jgi:hypothetical protein
VKKILVGGAGGAPSEGVIKSLKEGSQKNLILGMGSEITDLALSSADLKFYVPYAESPLYKDSLFKILNRERPDFIHFQNDMEIYHASLIRDEIEATGTKLFMPDHDVIERCVFKERTYLAFKNAGITVPKNIIIRNPEDLKAAFEELGDETGKIWLRSSLIGGGGKGAIPTNSFQMAKEWIAHFKGWGNFIAAEMLTENTITWLSIWHDGELIVAQTRERRGWAHSNRSISGVTGVTKVGVTVENEIATKVAINSVRAVSNKPHGIFGVDMAFDKNGVPNPTEINISRFFTTVLFFTKAGLNLPDIYVNIALHNKFPTLHKIINPLQDNLLWLRGMDVAPRLVTKESIEKDIIFL